MSREAPTAMHAYFMQRALELARRGWYTTRPNPRVGCVIVQRGRIVGEGWHAYAGGDHAEVRALAAVRRAGHSAVGAIAYVTLEPCGHSGRPPPCADALIQAGIRRVIVGAVDPNPAVDGRGLARLRDAGVEVVTGVLASHCEHLNRGFNQRMRCARPRVRVKQAMSLDGRTAAANGESRWITGEAARDDVHRLRAESGAVMVGSATQQSDDPSLTVRLPGSWLQPLRVVLDSRLAMSPAARMLGLEGDTLIFTRADQNESSAALEAAGARIARVAMNRAGIDLAAVMAALGRAQINDVLVEAGPRLAGALFQAGLVDEYIVYMAPKLLGDAAHALVRLPGVEALAHAPELRIRAIDPVGDDWRITARPRRPQAK